MACSEFSVTSRTRGLVASLIGVAYPRHLEAEIKRQRAAQRPERARDPAHVGTPGEMLDTVVWIDSVSKPFDTDYGPRRYVNMITPEGHALSWLTGSKASQTLETGWYNIRLKIKRHTHSRAFDTPETQVTHVKIGSPCTP